MITIKEMTDKEKPTQAPHEPEEEKQKDPQDKPQVPQAPGEININFVQKEIAEKKKHFDEEILRLLE